MSDSTRRGFVKKSAAAAAGMTVVGTLATEAAEAKASADSVPLVAYVKNAGTGEISVMSGERTVTVRDHQLAGKLARAAR